MGKGYSEPLDNDISYNYIYIYDYLKIQSSKNTLKYIILFLINTETK